MIKLKVKRLTETAKLPTYAHDGDACFDLYADDYHHSYDGKQCFVKTGLAFDIPEGFALMVYSRSGHGFKHNVRLSNCVGVIDSSFKGELVVSLQIDSLRAVPECPLGELIGIKEGDRIAQAMLIPVPVVELEEVDQLSDSDRGENGFGSSGK